MPFPPRSLALTLILPLTALQSYAQTETAESEAAESEAEEIMVFGQRQGSYTIITEDAEKLVNMPGAMGDPLGAITALPGVLPAGDSGEPAVRGSAPQDNRYFIDDMPAGYIFHRFNTSIFDENVVRDFQLYPAGFGAQYNNATGAIFDIHLRDPAQQPLTTSVTLSLLRAGVLLESQISENSSFYLSARLGLIQFFYPEEDEPNEDGIRVQSAPEDNDYIFKYLWSPDDDTRVTVNFAGAQDAAAAEFSNYSDLAGENPDFAGDAAIDDAFNSQSLRLDKTLESGAQWVTMLSHYQNKNDVFWGDGYFFDRTRNDTSFKTWLVTPKGKRHQFTFGGETNLSNFTYDLRSVLFVCSEGLDADCGSNRRDIISDSATIDTDFNTLYAIDQWQIHPRLSVEGGLQWHQSLYNNDSNINPRLALSWQWLTDLKLFGSIGRYDRLPDTEKILPISGNPKLASYTAIHYTLGIESAFSENWTWSIEGYLKELENLPLAIDESAPNADARYSNDQSGEVRGVDLFLNRNFADRWYGWISLSYTNSQRTNDQTNTTQNYVLDVPFILNIVGNYQLTDTWNAGLRFSAHSGEATTNIIAVKSNDAFPGSYQPVYAEPPFSDRLPTYARLDMRFKREIFWLGKDGSFFIDILNLLNRDNINEISLDYKKVNETGELHVEKQSDLGLFGSIGFSLTF